MGSISPTPKKIGSIKLDDDAVILDFTNYSNDDYARVDSSALEDGTEYTVYGFERKNSNGAYVYIIITAGNVNREAEPEEEKIGILDYLYMSNDDEWTAKVIGTDGKSYEYGLKDQSNDSVSQLEDLLYEENELTSSDEDTATVTAAPTDPVATLAPGNSGGTTTTKKAAQERVMRYSINSKGKMTFIAQESSTAGGEDITYSAADSKIGDIAFDENTAFVDLTTYADDEHARAFDSAKLADATSYTAYGYASTDGICSLVLILEGEGHTDPTAGESKIGVAESLYIDNDGAYYVTVIDTNAETCRYALQSSTDAIELSGIIYRSSGLGATTDKNNVQDRVIKYNINSDGYFAFEEAATYSAGGSGEEYNSTRSKIGVVAVDDNTVIMDFTDYSYSNNSEIGVIDKSFLIDGLEYSAYGYDADENRVCRYVIITDDAASLYGKSDIAVLVSKAITYVEGCGTTTKYKVYTGGEEKYLIVDPNEEPSYEPSEVGEPFFYTTNYNGYVTEMYQVVTSDAKSLIDCSSYETFVNEALSLSDFNGFVLNLFRNYDADGNEQDADGFRSDRDEAGISFGPVMDRTDGYVQLASNPVTLDGKTVSYTDDTKRCFDFGSDTYVYTVKLDANREKVESGTKASVLKSAIPSRAKYDYIASSGTLEQVSGGCYVAWDEALEYDGYTGINFALVKEYENELTDVVVFTCE